ncbi:MoaD/ThiS family protein [Bremerella cremea]|uniref:MoaD/ThiS family protein n=1 Tax=Bremerella cremea TaxID=1031537 RepID=UPI0031EEFB5A
MLRSECQGASQVQVEAATVQQALDQLQQVRPNLFRSVCDETGAVRKHIHLFLNDDLLHRTDGLATPLTPDDVLFIMTAVSGG